MKSGFDSAPRANKWRLKRTLRRATDYRPIENDDIRYAFAAYKHGALAPMGEEFQNAGMDAEQFKEAFEKFILDHYQAAWTLFTNTKKGFIPVGFVFGAWAPNAAYMIVAGMVWFPWSSKRNKIEAMVNFLNSIRKEIMLVFYALIEHKRMYEVCAMHGVIRRVGTSYVAVPGKPAAVFETRTAS